MKFLFVDTETSGLSPQKGQIIEIAGVLAELDPTTLSFSIISEFEELVAFRGSELDERVTRITGITQDDLKTADSITKVQDKWADWLESHDARGAYVVGHSVEFDLAFLKSESWFLPATYKIIDTLEVVKILLPEASAINLEYLVQRYGLSPQQRENRLEGELKAHRALYDTLCCMHLMQLLLYKLKDLPASQSFFGAVTGFFDLPLEFYSNQTLPDQDTKPLTLNKIGFDGELIRPNLYQKITSLGSLNILSKIEPLLEMKLPRKLKIIVLQLYTLSIAGLSNEKNIKYHGRDQVDFTFFEVLLDLVLDIEEDKASELVLEHFESIVSHIRSLSEKTFKLGKLMTYLEIYSLLVPGNSDVQKAISSYDFFLISLQPFWKRSEFVYRPFDLKPEEQMIRNKLGQLNIQLQELYSTTWSQENDILKQLIKIIKAQLEDLKDEDGLLFVKSNNWLTFRYWSNQIFVGQPNKSFRLNSALEQTILEKEPIITTCYSENDFWKFLDITGTRRLMENYSKLRYSSDADVVINTGDLQLKDFYHDKIGLAKDLKKSVLILCGQNSGLRDSEKVLAGSGDFDPGDYLILGDTGSLTKIASKVSHGFIGLVIVKVNDFDYFARLGLVDYSEIWILCQPYFAIHGYWFNLAKRSGNRDEYLRIFKFLYLKAVASKIYQKTQTTVNYQKGYSTNLN